MDLHSYEKVPLDRSTYKKQNIYIFEEVVLCRLSAQLIKIDTLASLMGAVAKGKGKLGMLMVGNVGVNFVSLIVYIRIMHQMVFQSPVVLEQLPRPIFISVLVNNTRHLQEE